MKKWILLLLPATLLMASCTKGDLPVPPVNEEVWLTKERGVVVSNNFTCDFFVVETAFGYSVLRSWGGFAPMPGSVVYGDLNRWGVRSFYVRTEGRIVTADVRDFRLGYFHALDAINWYCAGR